MDHIKNDTIISKTPYKLETFKALLNSPTNYDSISNYWAQLKALEKFEKQGKLRIYRPEEDV